MRIGGNSTTGASAGLIAQSGEKINQTIKHVYEVECFGPDGELKWTDSYRNLTTTEGLNTYLDSTLKTGNAAPAWYVGLVDGASAPTFAASDTLASHAGWSEASGYTGSRQQWNPGAVASGSVDNSASKAVFSITGNATIAGCFMASVDTGSSGVLLGEGAFTGGDRAVQTGDTLNVTVTATMT